MWRAVLLTLGWVVLAGCPQDPPPPPPPPASTAPSRPEDSPTFCVFEIAGADFTGEEVALVPDGTRADEEFWLYDAEEDVTLLGFVGTWKSWKVQFRLRVPGARATGTYRLGEDEARRGYNQACELSFHDSAVPREERPLLYLVEGTVTLGEQVGVTLTGTFSGTFASRRHGSLIDTPPTEWVQAKVTQGRFRARFDGAQANAQRWPKSE